jgi:hypothetical protein
MIVITTLAEYQTEFWINVGIGLKARGHDVVFLSFDTRSTEMLCSKGQRNYDIPSLSKRLLSEGELVPEDVFAEFDLEDSNLWTSHERITFSIADSVALNSRLAAYLRSIDNVTKILVTENPEQKIDFVQELGGFLSVIAAYFVAQKHNIDNYFLEPSFFSGMLFGLVNTYGSLDAGDVYAAVVSPEVESYIGKAIANQSIVIPKKDKHQYNAALKKIVNLKNLRRFVAKIIDKHVLGKHQEFGFIYVYAMKHLSMLINSVRMRSMYSELEQIGPFVYFPLHVPGDAALTLRSPEYLDQLALIEYLVRVVPSGYKIAIKEHPAQIGAVDVDRVKSMVRSYDNLVIINPGVNNYKVLGAAASIVSINSKSGAEAALLGKPVVVMGDAFYKNSPLVVRVEHISGLATGLKQALSLEETSEADRARYRYVFINHYRHD